MSEEAQAVTTLLSNSSVIGALIGAGVTIAIAALGYIWRLHTTANTNKTKFEEHVKLAHERDDHLNTKVAAVDSKVEKVDKNLDKLADKMDSLVDAHHQTHDILVKHVAHEAVNDKMLSDINKRLDDIDSAEHRVKAVRK